MKSEKQTEYFTILNDFAVKSRILRRKIRSRKKSLEK